MDHLIPHPELYDVPYTTDGFHGMPYRLLGRSGLRASVVGLGTWKFGYPETGDSARVDGPTSMAIMDRAWELGVTFWDTANRYNNASGNAERLIGQWLKANLNARRDIVVATKVFGGMDGVTPNHSRLSRSNILDALYACLERLQLDYVDLLYFHTYETDTPLEESLAAVEDLVRRDLVRYLGVSNVTVDRLRQHAAVDRVMSIRTRIIAVQNGYNIVEGEFHAENRGVLAYCARQGISFVPYSPLARGLLTNRYLDATRVGPGDRLVDEGAFEPDKLTTPLNKVRELGALAREWGLAVSELALAYTLALPGMGPVIPSASTVAQLESNARAGTVELDADQILQVKAIVDGSARDGTE